MKTITKVSVLILLFFSAGYVQAQEYDDMYFSSKDRKQVKKVKDSKSVTQNLDNVEAVAEDPTESYSAKTVNPEYIAKYKASSQESSNNESYTDDEYFDEDYDNNNLNELASNYQNNSKIAVKDRYGNVSYFNDYDDVYWSDPFLYEGTVFDPFYRPYRYNYGYRPYRSGLSLSFGFGNSWLSGYSYSTPYSGWRYNFGVNYGYGWGNNYGLYNPYYCPPYYGSYYGGSYYGNPYRSIVVVNNSESRSNRTYRRGPGPSRSDVNRSTDRRSRTSIASNNDVKGRSINGRSSTSAQSRTISTDGRNFENAQSKYYRRSRSSVNVANSENNSSGRSSYTGRSARSSSNYTPNTRSSSNSRSNSNVNRRSSTTDRSRNSRSNYNRSSNSRSNSSYSRPSNSSRSNNSFSSPSRSSNNSRSIKSSGSSSRSSSGNSSSRSRSSSSSRSKRGNN